MIRDYTEGKQWFLSKNRSFFNLSCIVNKISGEATMGPLYKIEIISSDLFKIIVIMLNYGLATIYDM